MRDIDPYTAERLSRQAASLCLCVRITRTDGFEVGLTNHHADLQFGGTLFQANPGMTMDSLVMTADLAPDHGDILTGLSEGGVTLNDIDADRYARARAEVWRVDHEDVAARLLLSAGTIGEITRDGDTISMEYRGQTHALSKVTGRLYQRSCDAQLGDSRCGVDLDTAELQGQGTVSGQDGLRGEIEGLALEAGIASGGVAVIQDGPLAGASRTIRTHSVVGASTELVLWEPFSLPLEGGEAIMISAGCDKRFATCRDRFSNALGFRGFPDIPGTDVLAVETTRRSQ